MFKKLIILLTCISLSCWIPAVAQQAIAPGAQIKPNVISPTSGLFTSTADLLRSKEFAKVLDNLQMTKRGIWTSRGIGYVKQRATVFNSGGAMLEMATHFTSYGTQRFVIQSGAKLYSYDFGTSTETEIGSGLSATAVPCMRSFSPTVFIYVNGVSEPQNWNGNPASTIATGAGWPHTVATVSYSKPTIVEVFGTRAVYAGFPANPYTVLISASNNANSFTISAPVVATDGGAFTLPSALGVITGLKTLRLGNSSNDQVLIVACRRGMAFIGGTDATNYYQRELTRTHGCLSNRSFVQVQNDLYYCATDGIRTLSNLNTSATLSPETLTYGIQNLYQMINTAAIHKIFAVHHPSTQEIQFWLPINADTSPQNVIVANYNSQRNTDGTLAPVFSTKSGIAGASGFDYNGTMYIGTATGYLQTHYSGDDYDGTFIPWSIIPALLETNSNNPQQSSASKRFLILTEGKSQAFHAEAYVVDTLSTQESQYVRVFDQRLSATSSTITNNSTWESGTTTSYPHIIEFDPIGTGRYWAIRLYAEQASDHVDLVGIVQLQTVGGNKQ
jgi:hypothetical protein